MLRVVMLLALINAIEEPVDPPAPDPAPIMHPAWAESRKIPSLWEAARPYAITRGADAASTDILFLARPGRRQEGATAYRWAESNFTPLASTSVGRWVSAAGTVYVLAYLDRELQEHNHPRWARALRLGTCGPFVVAAVINSVHAIRGR